MWSGLYDYQIDAVNRMKNGCILCGGVGSGKSRTAIAYYFKECGSNLYVEDYSPMKSPKNLYIITTARKRDDYEWLKDLAPFLLSTEKDACYYDILVVVDSWNNIKKYEKVSSAFFIFDEQRVVGSGAWVKSFLNITRKNKWILLSATPGDKWTDYIPVFVANGFYKHKTDFKNQHIIYRYSKANYPIIDHYVGTGKLNRYRNDILVVMKDNRETNKHNNTVIVEFNKDLFKRVAVDRWDVFNSEPLQNISSYYFALRKVVNSDPSREEAVLEIIQSHPKVIIFYNFNYELEILKSIDYGFGVKVAEWNGFKHEPIPKSESWVYLVQYSAGSEGWNCIETDTIIFYSQTYSYRTLIQSAGRIDRINTPFKELYYYHLVSRSWIDTAIKRALKEKKTFNESEYGYSRS